MKRAFHALLVLIVSALVFTSCKKDKDGPSIVGKWGLYEYSWEYTETGTTPDKGTRSVSSTHEDYHTLEFTSDGKVKINADGWESTGTYRIDGNKIYFKETGSTTEDFNEFTLSENELVLTEKAQGNGWSELDVDKYRRL